MVCAAVAITAQEKETETEQASGSLPVSITIVGDRPRVILRPVILNPRPSPFLVFLEPSPTSDRSTHHREDDKVADESAAQSEGDQRFQWSIAIKQSLIFLGVQHGYAMTQPKTRRDLKGPFFRDYFRSVKSLHGWEDGGRFFTNYIAHPLQGSFLGFIQVQNDPKGKNLSFNQSHSYWRSRMKALAWSAAWSTQFEIGPVSQASIGNVGLHGKQTYVDLVVTPLAGVGILVFEDFLDKNVIHRIERRNSGNFYLLVVSRVLLNPARSAANLVRFKTPWYRDSGLR